MNAIPASVAGLKDLADGTVRISFDFEPADAAKALALFRVRGTAVAVAALKNGHAKVEDGPKGGPLAKEAALLCANPKFQEWVSEVDADPANWIRTICKVSSRAELDHNQEAATLFAKHVRAPFLQHVRESS